MASEKGASSVFTSLPLEEYGFSFRSKRDFRDLLYLRYAKTPVNLQGNCACGASYSVDHSQICKTGGFIHHRHNEFEKVFAREASKVFRDVECEPRLQDLTGEEMKYSTANSADEARSDVRIRDFWGNKKNAFFDFRVFYPFASSYRRRALSAVYKACGQEKKRAYQERINLTEDGSFTPMVLSTSGGMGPEMSIAVKFLASRLAEKEKADYSLMVNVLRTKFAFAAARTALVCLRGSRSLFRYRGVVNSLGDGPVDLLLQNS